MTIETENVCFGYGSQPAVSNVSLKLDSGVFYGILGPNGCGKTPGWIWSIRHRTGCGGVISVSGQPLAHYNRSRLPVDFALVPPAV